MADLIIPERYREAHRNGLRRYLEGGKGEVLGRRIEVSGLRKNGDEFPVELSISPIRSGEGILFVGCLRDITERNAQRHAQVEVARVTQRLGMGEMAASIAHEINQPLAAIASNGYAGLRWLANPTPKLDEARDALERIVNDSQRAKEVVAGIRSMFKREGQAKEPQESTSSFVRSSPLFAVTRKINAYRFAPSYSTNSRKFRLARFSCAR
jgi:signal transduction histidine kinase